MVFTCLAYSRVGKVRKMHNEIEIFTCSHRRSICQLVMMSRRVDFSSPGKVLKTSKDPGQIANLGTMATFYTVGSSA